MSRLSSAISVAPWVAGVILGHPAAAQLSGSGQPGTRRSLISGGLGDRMRQIAGAWATNAGLQDVPLSYAVARVIMMFLSLLGIIFVGLITFAGYHWLTARGNEEKVRKAQDTIKQATWGLIVVLAAYSISYFLLRYLLGEMGGTAPRTITGGGG